MANEPPKLTKVTIILQAAGECSGQWNMAFLLGDPNDLRFILRLGSETLSHSQIAAYLFGWHEKPE